jgi:hypothetical protein
MQENEQSGRAYRMPRPGELTREHAAFKYAHHAAFE